MSNSSFELLQDMVQHDYAHVPEEEEEEETRVAIEEDGVTKESSENKDIKLFDKEDSSSALVKNQEGQLDAREKMIKNITVFRGICIVVGTIIGTGIFVSPNSITLALHAPGTVILVWIAGGFIAALGGMTYAELSTMIPLSGAEVTYIRHIFGPLLSFMSVFFLHFLMAGLRRSIGVLTYTRYFLSIFYAYPDTPSVYLEKSVAVATFMVLAGFIACKPTLSVKLISVITAAKVGVILLIIVVGLVTLGRGHGLENFADGFQGTNSNVADWSDAWSGVVWAYLGWEQIACVTSEVKNPQRNMPIIIGVSLAVMTVLYALTIVSFTLVLPYEVMSDPNVNIASTFGALTMGEPGRILLSFGVSVSAFGNVWCAFLTQSRYIVSAAQEAVLPGVFRLVSKRFRTPIVSIMWLMTTTVVFVMVGDISTLIGSATFTVFPFYVLCAVGVFVMRRRRPGMERPFRAPLVFPALFIVFGVYMFVLPFIGEDWLAPLCYVLAFLVGIPIYFVFVKDVLGLSKIQLLMGQLTESVAKLLNCD